MDDKKAMATKTQTNIDLLDKRLLNTLQSSFPLAESPYQALAGQLETTEDEVLRRISALKKANVVRQIGAIFDTRRLGYKTTLVAFRYPPEALDRAARVINKHPGVSHNYARTGSYNLWFTLAVPPYEDLDETIERIAKETHAETYRVMPTIRFFKIGVNFDMVKHQSAAYDYYSPDGYATPKGQDANAGGPPGQAPQTGVSTDWNQAQEVTPFEVDVIRELQEDLPLVPRPFDAMAERLGITVHDLIGHAQALQKRKLMRRFSAVLHHRKAGFRANAMAVWRVPEERADEVGMIMAESPWVTHCYQRPTFPDWPYTHFSMVHAKTRAECEQVVRDLSESTGITDYELIYSTREYKKTRVRYFVDAKEGAPR